MKAQQVPRAQHRGHLGPRGQGSSSAPPWCYSGARQDPRPGPGQPQPPVEYTSDVLISY